MTELRAFQARLSGTGGQGLGLGGRLLANALVADGMQVAQSQSYEPTSRGGSSRSDLVVSDSAVDYPLVTELDFLVLLDQRALEDSSALMRRDGLAIVDAQYVNEPPTGSFETRVLPLVDAARELGNVRVANVVSLGALAALGGICHMKTLENAVANSAPAKFRTLNLAALHAGQRLAAA